MHNNSTICFKICTICIIFLHKKIATTVKLLLFIRQGMRESNPHQKFWRLLSYHLTNPLYCKKRHEAFGCTFKTTHKLLITIISSFLFLSPYSTCMSRTRTQLPLRSSFVKCSIIGYALDLLVTVSYVHYCTSTSVLSTSSSSRGLTTYVGISHLEGGFTLRCLQRLSLPDLATLP